MDLVERIARGICQARGEFADMTFGSSSFTLNGDGTTTFKETISHRQWERRSGDARAALRAIEEAGYVVVPKEPSEGMLLAAFKQAVANLQDHMGNTHCRTDEERSAHSVTPIYRAMIAAALTESSTVAEKRE